MLALLLALLVLAAIPASASAQGLWNPPFSLADATDLGHPAVASDAAGNHAVAWVEGSPTGTIRFRRVAADGAPGPVLTVSDNADGDAGEPRVDVNAAGETTVVWEQGAFNAEVARARRIAPDGALGPILDLSAAGNSGSVRVDVNAAGEAIASWSRVVGDHRRVQARRIGADGSLGLVRTLTFGTPNPSPATPAIQDDGDALVVWTRANPESQVQARRIPAGQGPGSLLELTSGDLGANGPRVSARPDGAFAVVFSQGLGAPDFDDVVQSVIVPESGDPPPPQDLSTNGFHASSPVLATTPGGVTTAAWVYRAELGDATTVQVRRLLADGQLGPLVPGLSVPPGSLDQLDLGVDSSGNAIVVWSEEEPLFNVYARRVLADGSLEPAAEPQLLAGPTPDDGREASGSRVAVAGGGNALVVFQRSGGGNPQDAIQAARYSLPVPPPPPSDDAALLTELRLSPARFRAARRRGPSIAARAGTRVGYRLDRASSVRFMVKRVAKGRRVGGRCRKLTLRNRSRRPCKRLVRVRGRFAHAGQAGANRFRFTGRLRRRPLRPGRYRLIATPAGGRPVSRAFRIKRPARRAVR